MPLIDLNASINFDGGANSLYTAVDGTGLTRGTFHDGYIFETNLLVAALETRGLQHGQYIGILRSEFGWIAEAFVAAGYGPIGDSTPASRICCVDTSTWIHANKGQHATVNIVNADVNAATGRTAIRNQLGLKANDMIQWGISYEVLPLLADNEVAPVILSMRSLCTNVVHWLTPFRGGPPGQDARMNWKTPEAWKALVTPDLIAERGTAPCRVT